jgi:hypothetical protein
MSLAQFQLSRMHGNKIIIQSDNNSQVIDAMEGGFFATSPATAFDDCRVLAIGFREIIFEHCNREANGIDHELARHS